MRRPHTPSIVRSSTLKTRKPRGDHTLEWFAGTPSPITLYSDPCRFSRAHDSLRAAQRGDRRVLMFNGPTEEIRHIAKPPGARYIEDQHLRWLGGGDPHPALEDFPTAALLASPQSRGPRPRPRALGDMPGGC